MLGTRIYIFLNFNGQKNPKEGADELENGARLFLYE